MDNIGSILSEFYCKEEKSWKYSRSLALRCTKPLSLALKSFLRINVDGIICLQHLLNDDAETHLYIDCFIHPLASVSLVVCWKRFSLKRHAPNGSAQVQEAALDRFLWIWRACNLLLAIK